MRHISPQNRRRLGVIVGLALLLPLLAGTPAGGAPIDDKKAEAARIQAELDKEGSKVSFAAEQYNQARIKVDDVAASVAKAQADVARADERFQKARGVLSEAAVWAYVTGGSNRSITNLARSTNSDLVVRQQYLQFTAADQKRIMGDLKAARQDLDERQANLKEEQTASEAALAQASAAQRSAVDAENAQKAILGRVKGEIADLVNAEAARRSAEDAQRPPPARASAPTGPTAASGPQPLGAAKGDAPLISLGPPPPTSGGASAAVAEARAQIGKPYVYGGSGPDSFDCSGLVAWAWNAGGVGLSHSAQSQYYETTRVSTDNLQPGDLVFFGSSTSNIGHDAIYVGGGMMVEAPRTGLNVREVGAFRSDLVGAGRPG
ncbi:MAG TPA: NlpC/P60 family protein [Acidimicrobiales bacterium]|nr:NlpC/P60 family protein [Acidimicrobiales bacterium]